MAYNILVAVTIIALSSIFSANSLDIDVQPQTVRPNDRDVNITCRGSHNDTLEKIIKMFKLRLLRLDADDQSGEVAVLHFDGTVKRMDANVKAVGHLGDVLDSFLTVTWPLASDNIYGKYRCIASVLTSRGDVVTRHSRELHVSSLSKGLSLSFEQLKETVVGEINETVQNAMKSSKMNLFSLLDSKFGDLKEYFDNRTAVTAVTASVGRPQKVMEAIDWPVGNFTLLMPSDGCPLHPPAWTKSLLRIKAHPEDNYYPLDIPLHVANPSKKNGFIYRQLCTLVASPDRTNPWPAGSYCMYMNLGSCPPGFENAKTKLKVPSEKGNFYLLSFGNVYHEKGTFKYFIQAFCCRRDGAASSPIDLPTSHPFYLIRHGGRCQEVKGMDVTQDVFIMETMEYENSKHWTVSDVVAGKKSLPDVGLQPYKEELCYYSKSKV